MFPSPYGVSFILISYYCLSRWSNEYDVSVSLRSIIHSYLYYYNIILVSKLQFPSPYGVSFILIVNTGIIQEQRGSIESFRLLTEYHSFLFYFINSFIFSIYEKVSVSLRSIIHSYFTLVY